MQRRSTILPTQGHQINAVLPLPEMAPIFTILHWNPRGKARKPSASHFSSTEVLSAKWIIEKQWKKHCCETVRIRNTAKLSQCWMLPNQNPWHSKILFSFWGFSRILSWLLLASPFRGFFVGIFWASLQKFGKTTRPGQQQQRRSLQYIAAARRTAI